MRYQRYAQGFSLLELMLVLSLSGILMGVVATAITQGPVLKKAARDVLASLRSARAQAVANQKATVWVMDIDNNTIQVVGATRFKTKSIDESIRVKLNTAESELVGNAKGGIRFYPDGSSTGGSVELTANEHVFTVNVEWISGRISLD